LISDSNSLLTQIRLATRHLHAQLDDELGLTQEGCTRAVYTAFLRGSLAALQPLESQFNTGWRGQKSRCRLLQEDLASLGADSTPKALLEVPNLNSEAARMGARYVVEGSALGGAVLARNLDTHLGLNGESQRFLTIHGAGLAHHWRAFVQELEGWGKKSSSEMRAEACESAKAVFGLYRAAFHSTGSLRNAS
jgi:heme oxygenase (biliverdin-IX-beta and delta-forming)